ncbi:hypothetical protein [Polynucleobacter sp. UK-Kesae-W10]|nr:hypothetical protein [Polynucleobacter sp. UK-Kesae-W10]MBU3578057.1 hypothetical protein [Polynucleobacter sp. UK-Kesae-W10]
MVLSRSSGKSSKAANINYSTTNSIDLEQKPLQILHFGADGETRTRTA